MDPITTALAAGAAILLKGIASEAVKDAYGGLKHLLVSSLASIANLEEDPDDEDYRKATEKEIQKKGLADDPAILKKAQELTLAIGREPPARLAVAGIEIGDVHAARDIIVKRLNAAGNIRLTNVSAR